MFRTRRHTGLHYVFVAQVLAPPEKSSPQGIQKCVSFDELRNLRAELRRARQRVEMEKCQRSSEDIEKYGALTRDQIENRAQV